jgi:hypothetical protein
MYLLLSIPIVLESLPLRYHVSMREVEIPKSCPARDRAGRQTMGLITS